ncbi:MAG: DNA-processing protein DprA [Mariniblastus sp.]
MAENKLASIHSATEAALCLSLVPGIGPRVYADLVQAFGSPAEVLDAEPAKLREVPGVGAKLLREIATAKESSNVQEQLEICQKNEIKILERGGKSYPERLNEIYDPPSILFAQGNFLAADNLGIAIVGSRHASNYGTKVAEQLARGLAMAGMTIVSGLARGIDAAAHRGALHAGGRTIAVLGGGLLKMYPPEHDVLAQEIKNQGAVVTESLPLSAPKTGSFPRRNRIVTGLSLGVIVVEAGERSGALISARLAMEQGREVFAVPGRIDNRMSRGCHRLLRDGAKLVESVDDVLEELGPMASEVAVGEEKLIRRPAELKLTEQESKVLNAIRTDATEFDDIIELTELPPARVLSTISVLEMKKLVRRVSGTSLVRI